MLSRQTTQNSGDVRGHKPFGDEDVMITKMCGVWMNSKRAELVTITGDEVSRKTIESEVEDKKRSTGGTRAKSPYREYSLVDEKSEQATRRQALAKYYDAVMSELANVDRFFVAGPGVAKQELKNRILKSKGLRSAFEGVISADQMSENQIVETVREYFIGPSARHLPH